LKKLLSISLDLDNLWSYQKTHGDAGWDAFPSYLDTLSDIVLERLRKHDLTITFFVVGQDAALEKNHRALRALADAGHEIGNHSFLHEPWLHRYSPAEIDAEIGNAETHIEKATGKRPRGFRGPGFSMSAETLRVLARRGYTYDCSTFPTFIGALARAYYFWNSRNLSPEERKKREYLFGKFTDGLRPLKPYAWEIEPRLIEIPVTTMPVFRVPMHLSYLIYLARFSKVLCWTYLKMAVALCRLTGTSPSLLLHPLDFLGGDKVKELGFFPGMNMDTRTKLDLFDGIIAYLKRHFTLVTMERHAATALAQPGLAVRPLPV
jgi:hypothetical protein